jgi:hypothetical protein
MATSTNPNEMGKAHVHDANCGHMTVLHNDHIGYLHD